MCVVAWRRLLVARVVLGLVAGAAALTAVEIGLAFLPVSSQILPYRLKLDDPNLAEPYLEAGAYIPYTTRPNYSGRWGGGGTITLDADGFRTDPLHPGGQNSAVDVMCMGDSLTFGYLVDDRETYPRYLGLMYGSSKVVVNAGYYGGFTFDSAELRYRRALAGHPPVKVLVYGVFPPNDFDDLGVWVETDGFGRPTVLKSEHQVLNEVGYSVPVLRESRLFVGLAQVLSKWMRSESIAESRRLRPQRIADAVRRFRQDTSSTGTRLVFIGLREPAVGFAQYLAHTKGVSLDEVQKEIEAQVSELKAALDENHVEWYDDAPLLDELRAALARHQLPQPPAGLAVSFRDLQDAAAAANWNPALLAASDGVHYSGLTNAYVASWVYARLALDESR